jgi:uncharacterized protein (TIGR00290 family)
MPEQALILWSGGKDSSLALFEARQHYDIVALLTTVTEEYDRISMHGVRVSLLDEQARSLGIPLEKVFIPPVCANAVYEERMRTAMEKWVQRGVRTVVAGDLFLEDIRRYREQKLAQVGMTPVFPVWGVNTTELARRFIELGFRAVLCCVDGNVLDASFAGRFYDEALLADLPPGIDPCGENGEFHTFVFDGPLFARPIALDLGERVLREGRFWYCDLLGITPTDTPAHPPPAGGHRGCDPGA